MLCAFLDKKFDHINTVSLLLIIVKNYTVTETKYKHK